MQVQRLDLIALPAKVMVQMRRILISKNQTRVQMVLRYLIQNDRVIYSLMVARPKVEQGRVNAEETNERMVEDS